MKIKRLLFILLGTLFLVGCNNANNSAIMSTAVSQINMKANGHIEHLSDYDSPYTICYKNNDNTNSIYIFASPIQYKTESGEYEIIDNTVIKSKEEEFYFENKSNDVKTYFPKSLKGFFKIVKQDDFMEIRIENDLNGFSNAKLETYINMYGDHVSAVVYEQEDVDMVFYPIKTGIKMEIVIKHKLENIDFNFTVKSSGTKFENKQNGYIRFLKGENGEENEINAGLIYKPLVKYHVNGKEVIDIQSTLEFYKVQERNVLKIELNKKIFNDDNVEYPVKLDPSFELHQEKTPDSTIYSTVNINNYLANYAVVGKHPILGEGWHYSRMYINRFIFVKAHNIISANFHIKNLYSSSINAACLQMSSVDAFWSSSLIDWDEKVQPLKHTISPELNSDYTFDITEFVKELIADETGNTEIYGNIIQSMDGIEGYSILATSDNSVYTPYIHIKFYAEEL